MASGAGRVGSLGNPVTKHALHRFLHLMLNCTDQFATVWHFTELVGQSAGRHFDPNTAFAGTEIVKDPPLCLCPEGGVVPPYKIPR